MIGAIPRRARLLLCIVWLLCTRAALAAESPGTSVEPHGIYDPSQWTVVKSATGNFGKSLPNAQLLLLRSIPVTGNDGIGRPLDDLGGADVMLDLRDVTGDHVPEIIFHSGWRAAAARQNVVHVLQYTKDGPTRFRDIRSDSFFDSNWYGLGWLDLDGRTFAVIAEPFDPPVPPDEIVCQECPRFYRYLVYRWSQSDARFELRQTIPSTGKLHDEGPFWTNWSYIVAAVKKHKQ